MSNMEHRDQDGVRVFNKGPRMPPSTWLIAAALAAVVGIVAARFWGMDGKSPSAQPQVAAAPQEQARPVVATQRPPLATSRRVREPAASNGTTSSAARYAEYVRQRQSTTPENERTPKEIEELIQAMIDAARASGDATGVAAFPPHGTDRIKVGLVVPDDYALPQGFVRYHQVTDDGRRIEPILAFSPDYDFVDSNGQPVPLPDDGVVPPEMAPADMPQRTLEVPKNPYGAPTRPH
jgi:hypothetical protein